MKTLPVSELLKQLPDHIVATFFDDSDSPAVHSVKYVCTGKRGDVVYGADIVQNETVVRAFVLIMMNEERLGGEIATMFTGLADEEVNRLVGV